MDVVKYYETAERERWKERIKRSDWSAGAFLFSLLDGDKMKKLCGPSADVYLLTDGEELVSFAVLAEQDEVDAPELSPWIGFVYTFPRYRGRRCAGKLIERLCDIAKAGGAEKVYVSTDERGLYEKYGFSFFKTMTNRDGKPTGVYVRDLRG